MRYTILCLLSAVGLLASLPAQAGTSVLVVEIFKHECRKATADHLAFRCSFDKNGPTFTMTGQPDEEDKYRLNLLMLRLLQGIGGDGHFWIVHEKTGKRSLCGPSGGTHSGTIDNGIHPYAINCRTWQPSR